MDKILDKEDVFDMISKSSYFTNAIKDSYMKGFQEGSANSKIGIYANQLIASGYNTAIEDVLNILRKYNGLAIISIKEQVRCLQIPN